MLKKRSNSQLFYLVVILLLGLGSLTTLVSLSGAASPNYFLLIGIALAYIVAYSFGIQVETARTDSVIYFEETEAVVAFALLATGPIGVFPLLVGSLIGRYLEQGGNKPLGYAFNLAQLAMTYCVFVAFLQIIGAEPGFTDLLGAVQILGLCLLYPLWDDVVFSLLVSMGSHEPFMKVFRTRIRTVSWISIITASMGVLGAIAFRINPWLVLPAIVPLFLAHRATARLASINRELEAQVQVRTADLQRALEAKDEFLSIAAHELRTPLTSIVGSLGLLTDSAFTTEAIPPRVLRALEVAHSNSGRLTRLVNEILALQKLEADAMVFNLQPLDLGDLAEQAITANSSYADLYHVTLVLEAPPARYAVVADSERLLQVLTNLLSNACKFSPSGGQVLIRVTAQGDTVRIAVRDHGQGIPEDFRDRVFERFAQASTTTDRRQGGTGLGLSIAKSIVDKLNGRIGFETELQVGTTFFVDLPLYQAVVPTQNGSSAPLGDAVTRHRGVA
jgi:signal transduction histidine kinase